MSKASTLATKYVILGNFEISGYIDKPDLIGSFFGQTEGLIGEDLDFSNLQKTGKIGRIEIDLKKEKGKCRGNFIIPTALDKTEVSLVAAAIESITKISHCFGKIKITDIVDEREEKRKIILQRAEEMLKNLKLNLPQSSEIVQDINDNVKKKSIVKYDGGRIFGGPNLEDDDEIILVEGRADVLNLLKNGFSNVIAFNGSDIPRFIINLSKTKVVTAFLDSDRGGKHELEELLDRAYIDFYTFSPQGLEVEDLNIKEINKCLKNRIEVKIKKKKFVDKIKKVFNKRNDLIKEVDKTFTKINQNLNKHNNDDNSEEKNYKKKYEKSNNKNNQNNYNKQKNKNSNNDIIKKTTKKIVNKKVTKNIKLNEKNNKSTSNKTSKKIVKKSTKKTNKNVKNSKKINNLTKEEIKQIKQKVNKIKEEDFDFYILSEKFRIIKSGDIESFNSIKSNFKSAKYLILDAFVENSVVKKAISLDINHIICKKKFSKLDNLNIKITLFDEI